MKIFIIYLILVTHVLVSSTSIEVSSAPVALPDPESLINSVSCALFDVYKAAVVALHKHSSELLEATTNHLETAENEISRGTRSMLDAIRTDVNVVFGNFNAALTKLSDTIKEASDLGRVELQPAQVVWNELRYGVGRLRRNIPLIRAKMNKSLDEIRNNFENEDEQYNKAMNDLYTKVSNKLSFEVRSAANMFQHALSLPSSKYYNIDLEDIYQNWTLYLQSTKEIPVIFFKSAKDLINLIYNDIQAKFFLDGIFSDNSLWPLSSVVWGDAVQVKRFVDSSLRRLERYIKTSLAQIRIKFGKDSAALLEANQSLYNQIFSEVKQLIDLTEIPFKRIFNFSDEQVAFSMAGVMNSTYNGRFEELLKYLQAKGYPVQIGLAECIKIVSSDSAHSQAENFFDYLLNDAFRTMSTVEVSSMYTYILQEERIQEVTDIYRRLFNVVRKCTETAYEDGYKLPKIISMKIEDDAHKYTLLMNDIRAYTCKSACFIEGYYSPSSKEYQNAINSLCEDVKNKLDIAADHTFNSIKRLNNYLENHESCLEKFTLSTNSGVGAHVTSLSESNENRCVTVLENLDSNKVKVVNVLTSLSEADNIEKVGRRKDMKSFNQEETKCLNSDSSTVTAGTLEKDVRTSKVDIMKTEIQSNNSEDAHTAFTSLGLNQITKMNEQEVGFSVDNNMLRSDLKDLATNERTAMTNEDTAISKSESTQIEIAYSGDDTHNINEIGVIDSKSLNPECKNGDFINDVSTETIRTLKTCGEGGTASQGDDVGSNIISRQTENIQSINLEELGFTGAGQDVRLDEKPEDNHLINETVPSESTTESTTINKEDTITISEDQFTYEATTTDSDLSLEEKEPNNIEELTSSRSKLMINEDLSVLGNIGSSEEVQTEVAHTKDSKINEQSTDNLHALNKNSKEHNIDSTSTDIKTADGSLTSIVDTSTLKLADVEITTSGSNTMMNLDNLVQLDQLREISNDYLHNDQTKQQQNSESLRCSENIMSNLDKLEHKVSTISNHNSENILQGMNECDGKTETSSQHMQADVLKEIELPFDYGTPSREMSNVKYEILEDTTRSTLSMIETDNNLRTTTDSNLMSADNALSTNSFSTNSEQLLEIAEVKKFVVHNKIEHDKVSASEEGSVSSDTELEDAFQVKPKINQILGSASQQKIQQPTRVGLVYNNSDHNNNSINSGISLTDFSKKDEKEEESIESETSSTIFMKNIEHQEMQVDSNSLVAEHNISDVPTYTRSLMSSEVKEEMETMSNLAYKLNGEPQEEHKETLLSNVQSDIDGEQSQLEIALENIQSSTNSEHGMVLDDMVHEKIVASFSNTDSSESTFVNHFVKKNTISSNNNDFNATQSLVSQETAEKNSKGGTEVRSLAVDVSVGPSDSDNFSVIQSSCMSDVEKNVDIQISCPIFGDEITEKNVTSSSKNDLGAPLNLYLHNNNKQNNEEHTEVNSSPIYDNITDKKIVPVSKEIKILDSLETGENYITEITERICSTSDDAGIDGDINVKCFKDDISATQSLDLHENTQKSSKETNEVSCLTNEDESSFKLISFNDDVNMMQSLNKFDNINIKNDVASTNLCSSTTDDIKKETVEYPSRNKSLNSSVNIETDYEKKTGENYVTIEGEEVVAGSMKTNGLGSQESRENNVEEVISIAENADLKRMEVYSNSNFGVELDSGRCQNIEKNQISENNIKDNTGVYCPTMVDNRINEEIRSICNNNSNNTGIIQESSSKVDNIDEHLNVSSSSLKNIGTIDEEIIVNGDRFLKTNSISDEIIVTEGKKSSIGSNEVSIMNDKSFLIDDQITFKDSTINNAERQVEVDKIVENVSESKSKNIEETVLLFKENQFENSIQVGSWIENEAKETSVDSTILQATKETVEEIITTDVNTINLRVDSFEDEKISRNEIESSIQHESAAINDENQEHTSESNNAEVMSTSSIIKDSVDQKNEVSSLEGQSIAASPDCDQNENSFKVNSNVKTVVGDSTSSSIVDAIAGSTIHSDKELVKTKLVEENEQYTVINRLEEQKEILAKFVEKEITSNIEDENVTIFETNKSCSVTEPELNISSINGDTSDEKLKDDIASNALISKNILETQLENISVENHADQKQETLLGESLMSDVSTIAKKTVVKNRIDEQNIDISLEEFSKRSQPENIISTDIKFSTSEEKSAIKKVENGEHNTRETEPLYHMVWFPKKSWTSTVSPSVTSLSDDNYSWLGWLLPGKRVLPDRSSENLSYSPNNVYESRTSTLTSSSKKELEALNMKNTEVEESSKSEISQSSFTKINSIVDKADSQVLETPELNVDIVNDLSEIGIPGADRIKNEKGFELVATANSVASGPEESPFFKRWYNSFVKTK